MRSQLLVLIIGAIALTSSMVSARFFMLGDLEEPQSETDALSVNTTLLSAFTHLGHDVNILASFRSDVRGQIKYVLGARVNGKNKPTTSETVCALELKSRVLFYR